MPKQILIIEDNEDNLYLMKFLLEKGGLEVLIAKSGAEGLEAVEKDEPDLIIMDIQLPGMNGLRTTEKIIELFGAMTPIIAVTSYAMSGDRERALEAGCKHYMEKPIDPETFVEEIKSFL